MSKDGQSRRHGGPRALGEAVLRVARPLFRERGMSDGAVAADWPQIVGPELARHTLPERISYPPHDGTGGTLTLRIDSGSFATELQHLLPLLIERINGYFGYRAVGRVKLLQGPLPSRPVPPRPPVLRPLEPEEEEALARSIAGIADPELRASLEKLGRAILGRPAS
ncbi:MAG: DUF721 domain-containing protein [Magnetospirillum sp. WYHS-4]